MICRITYFLYIHYAIGLEFPCIIASTLARQLNEIEIDCIVLVFGKNESVMTTCYDNEVWMDLKTLEEKVVFLTILQPTII